MPSEVLAMFVPIDGHEQRILLRAYQGDKRPFAIKAGQIAKFLAENRVRPVLSRQRGCQIISDQNEILVGIGPRLHVSKL